MDYVLTPSSMWGAVYKARGSGIIRAMKKAELTQTFAHPILDHSRFLSTLFSWTVYFLLVLTIL